MTASEHGRSRHVEGCACTRCRGFEPGHTLSLRHGSYTSDLRLSEDPAVESLVAAIVATQPVHHPADAGACWRLALVYRRLELSAAALAKADEASGENPVVGYLDKSAWLERLRDDHARWLREAGRIEEQLARTPASRARLGLHLALATRSMTVVELHEAAALEGETSTIVEGE